MRCIKIYICTHISTHMVSYQYPPTTEYLRTIVSPTLDFNSCNVWSMVKISRNNLDMDLWCGIDQWPQIFAFSIYRVKARSQVFDRTSGFCLGGCFPKTSDLYMEGNRQKNPKNRYRRLGRHNPPVVFVNYGDKKDVVWTTFSCPQLENSLQVVAIVPVRSKYCEDTAGQQMCQLFLFCCVFQAVCDWVVWLIFTKPSNDPLDTHELTKDFQWTCRFRMYRFRGNSKTPVARTDLIEFFSAEWISPGQMKYIQSIFFCKAWMEQESMWQVLLKSQSYFAGGLWRQVTMGPGPWECCAAKTKIQLPSMHWLTDLPQSWGRGAYINGRYVANATKGGKGGGRGRDATGTTGVLRMLGKQIRNNRG